MGWLSSAGGLIVAVGVVGFFVGIYEAYSLSNAASVNPAFGTTAFIVGAVACVGLLESFYIGYLGMKVDQLDQGPGYLTYEHLGELRNRLDKLEGKKQRGKDDWVCPSCGATFDSRDELIAHNSENHGPRSLKSS